MSLFVYGTLMLSEIRDALLGKEIKHNPAKLAGYSAYTFCVENLESEYPVLKQEKGAILNGYLLEELTKSDYNILKFYEGHEFHLNEIDVDVNGETIKTNIFTTADTQTYRYYREWDLENFVENHLHYYLNNIIPELLTEINR